MKLLAMLVLGIAFTAFGQQFAERTKSFDQSEVADENKDPLTNDEERAADEVNEEDANDDDTEEEEDDEAGEMAEDDPKKEERKASDLEGKETQFQKENLEEGEYLREIAYERPPWPPRPG